MRVGGWWLPLGLGLLVAVHFIAARREAPATWRDEPAAAVELQNSTMANSSGQVVFASGHSASAPVTPVATQPFKLTFSNRFAPFLGNGQPAQYWAEFHNAEVGDVTGDGRDDVISLGQTEDPITPWMLYVYPQLPTGTLGSPVRYEIDVNEPIVGLSLVDMNNDRVKDVVITRSQGFMLGLSGPDGLLQIVRVGSTVADKKEIRVAAVSLDLDRDGNQDLVAHLSVAHGMQNDRSIDRRSRFRVFYGDGRGDFPRSLDFGVYGILYEPGTVFERYDSEVGSSLVVGDLNGDDYPDLALASIRYDSGLQQNPSFISIYRNDRLGRFSEPTVFRASIGYSAELITLENLGVGDFNADGRKDLVATSSTTLAKIWLFLQTPNGLINDTPSYSVPSFAFPMSLDGVDLDRNGSDDLMIGHSHSGVVGHHLQRGGSLGEVVLTGMYGAMGTDITRTGLATGDLNSDGCTDVAVAARFDGLQVFLGSNCGRRLIASSACGLQRAASSPVVAGSPARIRVEGAQVTPVETRKPRRKS